MAMLADKKRRQKWSLNPRGNEWSNDDKKFGLKLMERMGWREGKGLGANENGITEHVRVAYKNDSKGMGFKESVEWSHQQDNFSALLEELNNGDCTNNTSMVTNSLEKKSEMSRARVHYKKFTRGKDLSRYSEKDLANILGRRKLNSKEETIGMDVVETPKFGGNTTIGGSMVDYFKNKLPNFMTNRKNVVDNESETERNYGFGFKMSDNNEEALKTKKRKYKNKVVDSAETPSKKHKKQELTNCFINSAFDPVDRNVIASTNGPALESIRENGETSPVSVRGIQLDKTKARNKKCTEIVLCNIESTENESLEVRKRKKHKSKQINSDVAGSGIDNPCFNLNSLATYVSLNKDTVVDITCKKQLSTELKLKTKKKKHSSYDDNCSSSVIEDADLQSPTANEDKIRFEDKNQSGFDNPSFMDADTCGTSSLTNIYNPFEIKAKKKSKKCRKGVENPCFNNADALSLSEIKVPNNTDESILDNTNEFEVKTKSKHSKHKRVENQGFPVNQNVSTAISDNACTVEEKQKRKNKLGVEADDEDVVKDKIIKKHKRKKHLVDEVKTNEETPNNGIDNPALNLNDSLDLDDCDLVLNVTDEPVPPKVTKTKKRNRNVRFSEVNEEYIFEVDEALADDVANREELCNINSKVIEASSARLKGGLDNAAFNFQSNSIEESINFLTKSIEHCQAEVENGINESKIKTVTYEERMIGELISSDGEDGPHCHGVILRYKNAKFSKNDPYFVRQNDASASFPKKSYKHLIRGDIIIGFKGSNLHAVKGYDKPLNNIHAV